MRKSIIDIPAGVVTPVLATQLDRLATLQASSLSASGTVLTAGDFSYALAADGFTQFFPVAAGEVATIGDPVGMTGPYGAIIANGPGVELGIGPTPATTICRVQSTAGCSIILTEQA